MIRSQPRAAVAWWLAAGSALAADLPVNPGQSIQAAIAQAVAGDRVLVAPGTYAESIDFLGKAIEVRGTGGPAVTILDGALQPVVVVTFDSVEPPAATLVGFTIRDGRNGVWVGFGARPTLRNLIVEGHGKLGSPSELAGCGVYSDFLPGPRIEECILRDNEDAGLFGFAEVHRSVISGNGNSGVQSGGTLRECMIVGNVGASGGGVRGTGSMFLDRCVIADNVATGSGGGVSASAANGNLVLANCELRNNGAVTNGGGFSASVFHELNDLDHDSIRIENCVFSGNTAANGGGVYLSANKLFSGGSASGESLIRRSTFAGNGPNGVAGKVQKNTLVDCLFWDQSAPIALSSPSGPLQLTVTHCDVQGGFPGNGNLDVDPLFLDPTNGDFRLRSASPCIDAGAGTSAVDFEGDATGGANDIGGDEFRPHLSIPNLVAGGGPITMHVVGQPGAPVLLFASASRIENGVPTPYGKFALGFPLVPGFPLDLGAVPASSRVTLQSILPAGVPAGFVVHFQAFVGGTGAALTLPITLLVQ